MHNSLSVIRRTRKALGGTVTAPATLRHNVDKPHLPVPLPFKPKRNTARVTANEQR